jgi:hypothetical protein
MTDIAKKIKNKIQGTEAKAKTEEIMLKGNQAQKRSTRPR